MSLATRQAGIVAEYTGRYAIRGGTGLVFLLVALTSGLLVAHVILTPVEVTRAEAQGASDAQIVDALLDAARPAVSWAIGGRSGDGAEAERWTAFLLDDRPALLSAILLLTLFMWPFLITLGAFNQLSGDVSSRRIRYLLLRVPRSRLFFGRLAGTALFALATLVLLVAVVVLYLGLNIRIYGWGELLAWAAWGVVALTLVTLPYVALCAWISAAVDSPFGSLTVSALVVGGVPLLALIGKVSWEPAGYVRYLLPSGIHNHLLHHDWTHVLGAAAACLAYTAAFAALGHRHFARRDL
jgi:ABC-type transport system involved in multi-copper enzyme maturation permease subunit